MGDGHIFCVFGATDEKVASNKHASISVEDSKCSTKAQITNSAERSDKSVLKVVDSGWALVICAACCISQMLSGGIVFTFGLVFVELLDNFNGSKCETAVIVSMQTGVCLLIGPVVVILTSRFSCRVIAGTGSIIVSGTFILSIFAPDITSLYFSFGAMVGIGYGMIFLPSVICVSQHFKKRRAFATGIAVSGGGIGTFILSPLTSLLIEMYSWKGTLLIHAGLVLNCFAFALVYRSVSSSKPNIKSTDGSNPIDSELESLEFEKNAQYQYNDSLSKNPRRKITQNNGGNEKNDYLSEKINVVSRSLKNSFDTSIFQNAVFRIFLVSTFISALGYYVPFVYLPDTARKAGIEDLKASFLFSSIGFSNSVGRILFGLLSDMKCVNRILLYATALVICGAVMCTGPLLSSFESLLVYTMVVGALSGVTISMPPLLLYDIVGEDRLAFALGMASFFSGIAAIAGPPLAGLLNDISGDYMLTYVTSGAAMFIGGAMLYPVSI